MDLSTTYLGLELKNPIIVGSCGLTNNLKDIKKLEEAGAGAIVLKSIFEEQIMNEVKHSSQDPSVAGYYPEALDYLTNYTRDFEVNKYLDFIKDCKKNVDIPIIASVNCVSNDEWIEFSNKIEEAGADALEVNLFIPTTEVSEKGEDIEKIYFSVVDKIRKSISIPFAIKISHYFSNLSNMIQRLSISGINGLVLFNRFYSPDINLETEEIVSSNILSNESEITIPLKWIGYMSNSAGCDICGTTGFHTGEGVAKGILAGAKAIQIVSTIYKKGHDRVSEVIRELEEWMEEKGYSSISQFQGKLAKSKDYNPAAYERSQFMKYFSEFGKN
ncbi:MAG: diguanylate cyclase [Candidatus Cloacimonadota bacterium]|nr:MAG: diguanylate cyclase [Candidatus Cloacimonadota bacterium]PIE79760.1 MAG: diguanylate cyclase [Candidatus Delongbacteria bacterium]